MDGLVFFHYDDGSRSQETAWKLLQTFKGYLQSDGYAAYNIFEGKKEVCLVGCLAHIRRHYEVAKEENESLAGYVLAQIQQLYRIEQIADQEELTYEQRMLRRQEQALPILEQLENGWKQPIRKCFLKPDGASYRLRVSTLATYEELSERRQA